MAELKARIVGIARHRLSTDGDGITSLVVFHGCPLRCRYCINPQTLGKDQSFRLYSPAELFEETRIDELYFIATNGGVTFGGGEPCLHPQFIKEFRSLCGNKWHINLETSLNVPQENIESLLDCVDALFIDIKDMNPTTYSDYTGANNSLVINNLKMIADRCMQHKCTIRIPFIPSYNTDQDRISSHEELQTLGFTKFDLFNYIIPNHKL